MKGIYNLYENLRYRYKILTIIFKNPTLLWNNFAGKHKFLWQMCPQHLLCDAQAIGNFQHILENVYHQKLAWSSVWWISPIKCPLVFQNVVMYEDPSLIRSLQSRVPLIELSIYFNVDRLYCISSINNVILGTPSLYLIDWGCIVWYPDIVFH